MSEWPSSGPKLLWKADCGEGFSSVSVSDGRAFTLSTDDEHSTEIVYCWDAKTGREVWTHKYACDYVGRNGNGPRATPTIDGDSVYTVGATLFFAASDGIHGSELWKTDGTASGTVLVKDIDPGSAGSNVKGIVNVNGTLYFSANDGTHGTELWKVRADGSVVMVDDINPEKGKVRVLVSFFGRETPVELDFLQVQRIV